MTSPSYYEAKEALLVALEHYAAAEIYLEQTRQNLSATAEETMRAAATYRKAESQTMQALSTLKDAAKASMIGGS